MQLWKVDLSFFFLQCTFLTVNPIDGPALIILALVTANIRNCSLPSSKVRALDVFLALACHLTDEAKLDRMVPYVVELLQDDAALVHLAALGTLMQVVSIFFVVWLIFFIEPYFYLAHDRFGDHAFKHVDLP